uniref:Uncharacterized protein n=1 Tax=Arundo donax TaxID=35708 RepID=A0A0A9EV21_ARUDO
MKVLYNTQISIVKRKTNIRTLKDDSVSSKLYERSRTLALPCQEQGRHA